MTQRLVLASVVAALAVGVLVAPGRADEHKAGPPSPGSAPARLPPASDADHEATLRLHMHGNYDLVRAIERLLVRGKLEDAARFATAIAEVPDAPAHGSYAAQAVLVRDRAAAIVRATTVEQACKLEAKLAAACGGCHVDAGVVPAMRALPPAPPDVQTLDGRMARHRWAADRLWEGIVIGADEPWRAGLDVLAAAPFDWGDRARQRATLARDLQRLADTARKLGPSLDTRATSYGELLATCAACHTLGPAPAAPKK